MSIGFNINNLNTKNTGTSKLEIPNNFTHAIILGATGSGKTASCITPVLLDRMQKNHGILIFDFKGNYHYTIKAVAEKLNKLHTIKEVGNNYNSYINILEDIPIEMIESLLNINFAYDYRNKFWNESAISLATSILGIIKYLNELNINDYKYNFKTLLSITSNMTNLKKFKKFVVFNTNQIFQQLDDSYDEYKLYLVDTILTYYKSLDSIADDISLASAERRTLHSVVDTLTNPIARLSTDMLNINEINILEELIKGNTVVLSLNSFDENTLNMIVTSIFAQIRFNKLHYKQPITIIMDEAQKIINNYFELPLDILREYKVEVILATQSIANLKEKVKPEKIDSILANLRTQIYLDGVDMSLPKYTACVNNKHIKLQPLEFNLIQKFIAEHNFQKNYSKLKNNPHINFTYKDKDIIYVKHSNTSLLMKDKEFNILGKVKYIPMKYNKEHLLEKYSPLLEEPEEENDLYDLYDVFND